MDNKQLMDIIRKNYKRRARDTVFAIEINGDIYVGNRPDILSRTHTIKPIVLVAKEYETLEDYIEAIKNAVNKCIADLAVIDRLDNHLLYRRYNACLDLKDLLEGRVDYV